MTSYGLAQMPAGDRADRRRHRRREERGLPRRRDGVENRFEILGEAHVEHLVGFVEHDHLHGVEGERAPANVVERAARRRDDDVDAALERAQLLLHRLAAVDRQHADAELPSVAMHRFGDLHRELARRHEDQAAHDALFVIRGGADAMQQRQRERGGLARAGRGLAEHVAAGDQRRNGFALNVGRLLVAELSHRGDERRIQAEREKGAVSRARRRSGQSRCVSHRSNLSESAGLIVARVSVSCK